MRRSLAFGTAGQWCRAWIAAVAASCIASPGWAVTVEVTWSAPVQYEGFDIFTQQPIPDDLIGAGTVSGSLGSYDVTAAGGTTLVVPLLSPLTGPPDPTATQLFDATTSGFASFPNFPNFPNAVFPLDIYGDAFTAHNIFPLDFGDLGEFHIAVPVDLFDEGSYTGDLITTRANPGGASSRVGQMGPGCTSVDPGFFCQARILELGPFGFPDLALVEYRAGDAVTQGQSFGFIQFAFTVHHVCGDGVTGGSEQCDDGNQLAGDGCRASCTEELCGDGILDPQEACDDGNVIDGDGCQANCALPVCGDGILDPSEECDDGGVVPADGCSETCHLEVCGNGTVDPGEQCDDANAFPGDDCRPDCTQELCGDGTLDPQEGCDDGNNTPGDGCRADCSNEVCGDGTLDPGEQCDDGNTTSGDGCQAGCALPLCGDAVVDAGEQCDDGNVVPADGCSASCQDEVCGNGILDPLESCDDGNSTAGDGCRADCTVESCGDGILDPQEQCDDGNLAGGDGCSAACETEMAESGQGCSPGYWKQEQHFDSWPAPYAPETPFDDVFENAFPNRSLVQVMRRTGGGLDALGQQAVAALLNAASSGVSYDLAVPDVIQMFDQTFPGTKAAYSTLKNNFETLNQQGCPLN